MKQMIMKNILLLLMVALVFPAFSYSDSVVNAAAIVPKSSTIAVDKQDGTSYLYIGVDGEPAHLLVYNLYTNEYVRRFQLPEAASALAMTTGTDGNVYIGTSNKSKLFRHVPGTSEVEDLGLVIAGETAIYNIENGSNGKLYGSTYPNAKVFEYDIALDAFTDLGSMVDSERYARRLDVDVNQQIIYTAVGPTPSIIKYDINTGEKSNIMPSHYISEGYPDWLGVRGNQLFVRLGNSQSNEKLIVMDTDTEEVIDEIGDKIHEKVSGKSPYDDKVYYFTTSGDFNYYDMSSKERGTITSVGTTAWPRGMHYHEFDDPAFPGITLVVTLGFTLFKYNLQTGEIERTVLNFPGSDNDEFVKLGTQMTRAVPSSSTIASDQEGTPYVYYGVDGDPAHLVVFNLNTKEYVQKIALPNTSIAWTMTTGSDGNVYIGSSRSGRIYRHTPGTTVIENLGVAIAGETHIWSIENGDEGKLYGGTYPGGKVFEYDIALNQFTDLGRMTDTEQYVRRLDVDANQQVIYTAIGAKPHLIKYDMATGAKSNILPEQYKDEEYPYWLGVRGENLFVRLGASNKMIVMDTATEEVIEELGDGINEQISPKSPVDDKVYYFTNNGALSYYDMSSREKGIIANMDNGAYARSIHYHEFDDPEFPGSTLVATLGYTILKYNLQTGKIEKTVLNIPGAPHEIRSLAKGPDGKIYSGGYKGATGVYDPIAKTNDMYNSIHQPEAMTFIGDKMYYGGYPKAEISELDTTQLWNFKKLFSIPGQDRPFGMLGVEKENKLFIGTVADYGRLDGALTIYDLTTEEVQTINNIVENQGVVSLAYKDGKVYGGTTIWGGLGIAPTEIEGKLFVWDVGTKNKILEITPVPGKRYVTGLIEGPDGNIWGIAEGNLFIFDPVQQQIIYAEELFSVTYEDTVWADATLEIATDGNVYGVASEKFFRIDAATKECTIFTTPSKPWYLAQDDFGNFYYRDGKTDMWRYSDNALLVYLDKVAIALDRTTMAVDEQLALDIQAYLEKGRKLSTSDSLHFDYFISNPEVVSIENGLITALQDGEANIQVALTVNGVTKKSNKLLIRVGDLGNAPGPGTTIDTDNDTTEIDEDTENKSDEEDNEESGNLPTAEFTDISNHWAKEKITQAAGLGIIKGYGNHTFQPDRSVTRAEFAAMAVRLLNRQGDHDIPLFTDDADIPVWAEEEVEQAIAAGLLRGYKDGTLRPNAKITRAEMVTILMRSLQKNIDLEAETSFKDDGKIPAFAKAYVMDAVKKGLIFGRDGHVFAPNDLSTRAEAATFLLRCYEYLNN